MRMIQARYKVNIAKVEKEDLVDLAAVGAISRARMLIGLNKS